MTGTAKEATRLENGMIEKCSSISVKNAYFELLFSLIEAARLLSDKFSLDELMGTIRSQVIRIFDASSMWIIAYDPEDDLLEMKYYWGPDKEKFKEISIKPGVGAVGEVFLTQRSQIIFSIDNHPVFKSSGKALGKNPVIATLPLTTGDRKLGVFGMVSESLNSLELSEVEVNYLMSAFASQVAVSISNAVSFEQSKKIELYTNRLRLLNSLSQNIIKEVNIDRMMKKFVDCTRSLLGCSTAAVILFRDADWQSPTFTWSSDGGCFDDKSDYSFRSMIRVGLHDGWIGTRKPICLPSMASGRINYTIPEEHSKLHALLSVPLFDSEGNFLGQLLATSKRDGSDFSETDEDLIIILCAQVAIAIEKAQLYEREHNIAEVLQQAILEVPRDLPGVEIGIVYESAVEIAKVGGDFYDLFELGDGMIGVLIGDVSGKGLEAAAITSMVKSTIRAFAYKGLPPKSVLNEANRVICRQLGFNQFVTMVYCVIDNKKDRMTVCNAGHPGIIIWRDYKCELCQLESNLPIGIKSEIAYIEDEIDLMPDDYIILYTDGLTEARHGDRLFGEDRLIEGLNMIVYGKSPQQIANSLVNMAKKYTDGKPQDDIAIVAIKIKGDQID